MKIKKIIELKEVAINYQKCKAKTKSIVWNETSQTCEISRIFYENQNGENCDKTGQYIF